MSHTRAYSVLLIKVRAGSGFFDDKLLSFLEQRELSYIVVARMTPWLKRQAAQVRQWTDLDANYSVGEFPAAEKRFLDLPEAIDRLRQINFHSSPQILEPKNSGWTRPRI